jgi:CheY-like chemotaxis protein
MIRIDKTKRVSYDQYAVVSTQNTATYAGEDSMVDLQVLTGKRILAVDDEPDVLEVIREGLSTCAVTTARDFASAKHIIENAEFDLIILDIMGVRGFELLDIARKRRTPVTMLTAHAVTVESLNKSLKLGATSFLPKDELARLPEIVAEIFESLSRGEAHWPRLFKRLGPFFKDKLGLVWEDLEKLPGPPYY